MTAQARAETSGRWTRAQDSIGYWTRVIRTEACRELVIGETVGDPADEPSLNSLSQKQQTHEPELLTEDTDPESNQRIETRAIGRRDIGEVDRDFLRVWILEVSDERTGGPGVRLVKPSHVVRVEDARHRRPALANADRKTQSSHCVVATCPPNGAGDGAGRSRVVEPPISPTLFGKSSSGHRAGRRRTQGSRRAGPTVMTWRGGSRGRDYQDRQNHRFGREAVNE